MIVLLQGAAAFGAVERYAVAVAEGLLAAGEEVALVYPDVPDLEPFLALGERGARLEPVPPAVVTAPFPGLVAVLRRRLRMLRPRVAHAVDVWPAAAVAARLARVPRLLVTHHTPELPRRGNLVGRAVWELGWLMRPEVVYTSESDRRHDGRRLRTHVVYLGIDLGHFASAEPALARIGSVVGNVGRLAEQKGQAVLVDAAPRILERHPETRFVVVGEGPLRESLEQRARATGVGQRFLFTGDRRDVPELLASFDVFALPSYYEGLCYAVLEAQAAGLPVVATPVGGVAENVVPGETGYLCAPGDPVSLADAIVRLLDDPETAKRLGEEGRRRAVARFSLRRMIDETLALYI